MNTKNNDPFEQKQSPFGPPRSIQSGSVPLPKPRNTEVTPQLPPLPGKPLLPPLPNASQQVLFPEADTYEVEESTEPTDAEIYRELFDEELPEGVDFDSVELSDEDDDYISRIFESGATPSAQPTLYALVNDSDWMVRNGIALNPDATPALLDLLAKDESSYVRESVMENPNCSINTYRAFAQDEDELLVSSFIENDRTTEDMLVPLYNTQDAWIAGELYSSPLVPQNVKTQLRIRFEL